MKFCAPFLNENHHEYEVAFISAESCKRLYLNKYAHDCNKKLLQNLRYVKNMKNLEEPTPHKNDARESITRPPTQSQRRRIVQTKLEI